MIFRYTIIYFDFAFLAGLPLRYFERGAETLCLVENIEGPSEFQGDPMQILCLFSIFLDSLFVNNYLVWKEIFNDLHVQYRDTFYY